MTLGEILKLDIYLIRNKYDGIAYTFVDGNDYIPVWLDGLIVTFSYEKSIVGIEVHPIELPLIRADLYIRHGIVVIENESILMRLDGDKWHQI